MPSLLGTLVAPALGVFPYLGIAMPQQMRLFILLQRPTPINKPPATLNIDFKSEKKQYRKKGEDEVQFLSRPRRIILYLIKMGVHHCNSKVRYVGMS